MKKKIAIQGFEGSFHQVAAQQFFNNVEVICCTTFREVVKIAADKRESDGGIMAIENSIAGSILPNYNLLQKTNLKIIGEVYLQCIDFLEKYNWKLIETDDTALSAKHIHQHRSKHIAAIASRLAADLYELDVLAPNIHTLKNNYTRFLVLQHTDKVKEIDDANKASIIFNTDHSKGSLAKVLTKIAEGDINLSKLQSMPIPGSDWKYSFHADMEFDTIEQFNKVIQNIAPLTDDLKIYGIYKNGK